MEALARTSIGNAARPSYPQQAVCVIGAQIRASARLDPPGRSQLREKCAAIASVRRGKKKEAWNAGRVFQIRT